jgi:hypothetical protein
MDIKTYRTNREKFSAEDLRRYDGKWVAFSGDGSRIVASADDIETLDRLVRAAGEKPDAVGLERIEFDDTILGGAELM